MNIPQQKNPHAWTNPRSTTTTRDRQAAEPLGAAGFVDSRINHHSTQIHTTGLRACLLLAWLTAITIAQPTPETQTFDLTPHFTKGRTTRYQIWSQRIQNQTLTMGQHTRQWETQVQIDAQVSWAVEQVRHDGSAKCRMTLEWITAKLTGPDSKTLDCDSRQRSGKPEPFHQLLRAMAGVPLTLDLTPDGQVRKIQGTDAIRRQAPQGIEVPDDSAFIDSANELAVIAKGPPATKLNQKWDAQFSSTLPLGKLHQSMRYALGSVETLEGIPIATITGTAKLRFEPQLQHITSRLGKGAKAHARLKDGHVETQILFDLQRHEAVGRNTIENRRIETRISWQNQLLVRTIDEQIHSQALRIVEEE